MRKRVAEWREPFLKTRGAMERQMSSVSLMEWSKYLENRMDEIDKRKYIC